VGRFLVLEMTPNVDVHRRSSGLHSSFTKSFVRFMSSGTRFRHGGFSPGEKNDPSAPKLMSAASRPLQLLTGDRNDASDVGSCPRPRRRSRPAAQFVRVARRRIRRGQQIKEEIHDELWMLNDRIR